MPRKKIQGSKDEALSASQSELKYVNSIIKGRLKRLEQAIIELVGRFSAKTELTDPFSALEELEVMLEGARIKNELALRISDLYNEHFPNDRPTSLVNALEKLLFTHQPEPVADISDVPDRPGDVPKDNWRHRADNMTCATCMWYVPKHTGKVGRCRAHAPTMKGWPVMFPDDWCGNHKLDEERA